MTCEMCSYPDGTHADWCSERLRQENIELRRQVELYKGDMEHYKELAKVNIDEFFKAKDQLATREAELASMTKAKDKFYNDMLLYKRQCDKLIDFRETLFGAIKKRDKLLEYQIEYDANLLADRDARIADMREILQDVLSDCHLTDGMRNEIEKRISGKESGK